MEDYKTLCINSVTFNSTASRSQNSTIGRRHDHNSISTIPNHFQSCPWKASTSRNYLRLVVLLYSAIRLFMVLDIAWLGQIKFHLYFITSLRPHLFRPPIQNFLMLFLDAIFGWKRGHTIVEEWQLRGKLVLQQLGRILFQLFGFPSGRQMLEDRLRFHYLCDRWRKSQLIDCYVPESTYKAK